MRLKDYRALLQTVRSFEDPKIKLEQYITPAEVACDMLYSIDQTYGDIEGSVVLDLGVGTGMLSIGCAILGAEHVVGIDIDPDALQIAHANLVEIEADDIVDLVHADVLETPFRRPAAAQEDGDGAAVPRDQAFDVVFTNPPFGTKRNKGIDINFLRTAISAVAHGGVVYSLHKSTTRRHVLRKAEAFAQELADDGAQISVDAIAQLRYNLDASYRFHKKRSVEIEVDVVRTVISPTLPS